MKRLSCASWITCERGWVTSWKTCPPIALEPLRLCKIRSPARESSGFKSISPPLTEIIHHLSSPLLDDEASKLRILDYLRKWLGDKLEDMPANRARAVALMENKKPRQRERGLDGRSGWLWADTGPPSEFHQTTRFHRRIWRIRRLSCFSLSVCLYSDSTVLRRLTGSHQARGAPFRRW